MLSKLKQYNLISTTLKHLAQESFIRKLICAFHMLNSKFPKKQRLYENIYIPASVLSILLKCYSYIAVQKLIVAKEKFIFNLEHHTGNVFITCFFYMKKKM